MKANNNLLKAIDKSNIDGVNKALNEGANPDLIYNSNFDTVMMLAIKKKDIEIIERLLEENLNLKLTNKSGQTALDLLLNQSLYKEKPPQTLMKDIIKNAQDRIKQDVHLKTKIICRFLEKGATTETLSEEQKKSIFNNNGDEVNSITNFLTSQLFSQTLRKKNQAIGVKL